MRIAEVIRRPGKVDPHRADRRFPASAETDARLQLHVVPVVEGVAGIDEECEAPVVLQRMLVLEARDQQVLATDDGAIGVIDGGRILGAVTAKSILGAIATETFNWRAAFFMIIPPGIATMACIWFALSQYTSGERVRFDWTGFLALSTAIIAAQLVFDRGHKLDWFESN